MGLRVRPQVVRAGNHMVWALGSKHHAGAGPRCQAKAAGTGPGMVHSLPPLPVAATDTSWQSLYGAGPMFANELLRDAISRPSFSKLSDCHALGLGAAVIVLGSIRPGEPRCGC